MGITEWIRMTYGLLMGTSVQFLKSQEKPCAPLEVIEFDSRLKLLKGGTANAALYLQTHIPSHPHSHADQSSALLINAPQYQVPDQTTIQSLLQPLNLNQIQHSDLVLTSLRHEVSSHWSKFHTKQIWAPFSETSVVYKCFGERPAGLQLLRSSRQNQKNQKDQNITPYDIKTADGVDLQIYSFGMDLSRSGDLLIFDRSRRLLITGSLVTNRVHPDLNQKDFNSLDVNAFIDLLNRISREWQPESVWPGHGALGGAEVLRNFIQYLQDLADPSMDYQECRRRYEDWAEIVGHTSLEENFDLIRNRQRTYIRLSSV